METKPIAGKEICWGLVVSLANEQCSAPVLDLLDAQKLPLEIGAAPPSKGSLANGPAWDRLEFGFLYRQQTFGVTAFRDQGTLRVATNAHLGLIPYSAQDPDGRKEILAVLGAIPLRPNLRFEVTPTQQLFLRAEQELALPHTPVRILAAITALLDTAAPHLDRLSPMLFGNAYEAAN